MQKIVGTQTEPILWIHYPAKKPKYEGRYLVSLKGGGSVATRWYFDKTEFKYKFDLKTIKDESLNGWAQMPNGIKEER